ncbi:GLPGLI family protein [Riemerella anatipestifer]|uniref:GLPGLI family protein n=1 Tax=Riemerella anatipestifer TaxID=34085 RepID=UPI0012AEAD40|nr:GLPGLI family protein [Riemerella anatipestifer]USL95892.1 GLPGLI family protein [Riemerella anatipestifer]
MKYLYFFIFFTSIFIHAQTTRLVYRVSSGVDSERVDEIYYLDVDTHKKTGIYYNRNYFVNDSIFKKTGEFGFSDFKMTDFVKVNFANNDDAEEYKILSVDVFKIHIKKSKDWKMEKETRLEGNRTLQKATIDYGGRQWEAWWDKDFPLYVGPYLFSGLPGLIVSLKDTQNHFHFELIGVQNFPATQTIDFLTTLETNSVTISIDKFKKMLLQNYNDPFGSITKGLINRNQPIRLEDGTLLTKDNLKVSEEVIKNRLRKQNPIHLDFKVAYPDK